MKLGLRISSRAVVEEYRAFSGENTESAAYPACELPALVTIIIYAKCYMLR